MEIKDLYLQSQTHKIINQDKKRDLLSHAYMIECSDRFLLDNYAKLMAQEIFCLGDNCPCFECLSCQKVMHDNMVDLKKYPQEKKIVVEDINAIIDDAYKMPMDVDKKVYILNNFDEATVQSQNKILKTLEEPPHNVIFILTCSNSNVVLQTVLSRVKSIEESLLSFPMASQYLASLNVKNYESIAKVSGGNIFTALKLANSTDTAQIVDLVFSTLKGLKTSSDIIKYSCSIIALKNDFRYFLDTLNMVLRDVVVCREDGLINFENNKQDLVQLSEMYSILAIEKIIHKLNEIYLKLEFNCNLNSIVDKMLLDILEVRFLCQK